MTSQLRHLVRILAIWLGVLSPLSAAPNWKEVYNPLVIRTLHIELSEADWDRVRHDQPMEGQTESQERAEAWFRGEGETPIRVEIRRKGQTDPPLPSAGNPQKVSLKVDFNAVVPGQTWHGLRKISLENGGDAGPLHEGFAWQVHRLAAEAGYYRYDAANAAWVKVYVNGSYKGVYVSTEQRDEQFLRNRDLYSPYNTWLYKVDGQDYLELGTGTSPTQSHLNFQPFTRKGTPPDLGVDLPQWIDMESMLTLAACEVFVENTDGLVTHSGKNSFAADFNPPNTRRRMYFPWDMDASIKSGSTLIYGTEPYQEKILGQAWLGRIYEHTFRELLAGPLSVNSLHAFLNQLEPVLAPALESDPYIGLSGGAAGAFASLRNWVNTRVNNVSGQLLKPHLPRPVFSHAGGEIVPGLALSMTAPAGQIYYTTNGTDPRALNGAVAAGAILYAAPLTVDRAMKVTARALNAGNWSGLATEAVYQVASYTTPLRVTEIMYHPSDPNPADAIDKNAYEFLELQNTGATAFDLSGYHFDGITYTFPAGSTLAAGGRLLVVRNATAFAARYPGVTAFGVYLGSLSDSGEKIRLRRPDGATVISVDYDDDPPWVLSPDGFGYSLVNRNVDGNPDDAANWRASRNVGGSPGADDPEPAYATRVVINEVLANSAGPFEDAVEIQNTGTTEADLGNWYLSNEARNATGDLVPALLKKYRLPPTTVAPGGYTAFYEGAFGAGNPLVPFALNPHGGRVYLSSADAAGNLTGHIIAVEFPAADPNVSFGRVATSDGIHLAPLSAPTFGVANPGTVAEFRAGTGASNAPPRVGPVVISEIMYNPVRPGSEFVELHNISANAVDISGWDIDGIAGFAFPNGTIVAPGGFVVLVDTATTTVPAFRAAFNVPAEALVFGHSFDLGNAGEALRLEKPNPIALQPNILVERVRYNDKAPWPPEADGTGMSLERLPAAQFGQEPLNWKTAAMHGTPGRMGTAANGVAIARNSFWNYRATSSTLGTAWRDLAYNASAWDSADTPAGYGEAFLSTVIPFGTDDSAKYPTTYFRKAFVLQVDPAAIDTLRLSLLYDDGIVVYLNGTEIARRELADGPVDYATLALIDREAGAYEEVDLQAFKSLLLPGQNVLAVEVHQSSPASPDLVWDAELTYTLGSPPVDADDDGLPASWELANGLNDADPTDAALDADGDGLTNAAEYVAGTDPRDPASSLQIDAIEPEFSGGFRLRWRSVPGKRYRVSYTQNLEEWFTFGAAGDLTATGALTEFTDPSAAGALQRFYRVSVIP